MSKAQNRAWIAILVAATFAPIHALAQVAGEEEVTVTVKRESFRHFVKYIVNFIDTSIIPLLFALAFVAILFGTLRYFFFEGEENLQKGRQFLLWGGLSFVLMFVIWGVVRILVEALRV